MRRHILTAPYQSWFRFTYEEYWDRRDLDKEYTEKKEQTRRRLIEEGLLTKKTPLYKQEEIFKENGYGDDWRDWERYVNVFAMD